MKRHSGIMRRRTFYVAGFLCGLLVGSRIGIQPYRWTVQSLKNVQELPKLLDQARARVEEFRSSLTQHRQPQGDGVSDRGWNPDSNQQGRAAVSM
jgi:hypothetical protein